MKVLIRTTCNLTFNEEEVENLRSKLKSFVLFKEEDENNKYYYYVFIDMKTIEELNTFVQQCGYEIVYGNKWEANGIDYFVIEIYNGYRE